MTSAPGAFLTIKPGGPLDGAVAISAPDAPGRLLVEASWTVDGDRRMASVSSTTSRGRARSLTFGPISLPPG
jgi:hypothetical protein